MNAVIHKTRLVALSRAEEVPGSKRNMKGDDEIATPHAVARSATVEAALVPMISHMTA